jgi:hypothetical protein
LTINNYTKRALWVLGVLGLGWAFWPGPSPDAYAVSENQLPDSLRAFAANARAHPLVIGFDGTFLTIDGPAGTTGRIHIYRAGGADRASRKGMRGTFHISAKGPYRLQLLGLPPAAWAVALRYHAQGKDCYQQYRFQIPTAPPVSR